MNPEIVEAIFPGTKEKIEQKKCPTCNNDIGEFRDERLNLIKMIK